MVIRLLLLLGVVAQALLFFALRDELAAAAEGRLGLGPEEAVLFLLPLLLALGGAGLARWLRPRAPVLAALAAWIPLVLLGLGLGIALLLTLFPVTLHHR